MAEILVNINPHEVRIALLENNKVQELYIERSFHKSLMGNIYKGKIKRILPGIQAAFIDIGLERAGFLHLSDLLEYENKIRHGENHTALTITDFLNVGQELFVQVYKDPIGTKAARLTTRFTIPSRYLVFTPGQSQISVSQKIENDIETQRLISMIQPEEEGGYIFRTAAEGAPQVDIETDQGLLRTVWRDVSERARQAKCGEMVYEEIPLVLRVLRDWKSFNIEKVRVDDQTTAFKIQEFAKRYLPDLYNRIEFYDSSQPIFDLYSVENELQKALQRKMYLKSGGHVVFDQTEAMTTIDVNTGSYVGSNNSQQTLFQTNCEAIDVIARQLRLRNLGGIIIIDFIDMDDLEHKKQLFDLLTAALAKDTARIRMSELSSLGLVQLTRKRARESLEHVLCVSCPVCHRRGSIKSVETICYEIFRDLKRMSAYDWPGFMVEASASVVNCLQDENGLLVDLAAILGKSIKLRVESSLSQENYTILPWSERE